MTLFRYQAMNPTGAIVAGRIDAANLADLETRLARVGLDLIDGAPLRQRPRFGGGMPRRTLINFCFHLEQLTSAGVPIIESLVDLRDSIVEPPFSMVLAGMVESVEGGKTLSQAMAEHPQAFDEVAVSLIRAGEDSGKLPEVLTGLVAALKWQDELAAQTRKLALYPAFLAAAMLGLIFFMMIYLVPKMVGFMRSMGHELPLHTQVLIAVSGFIVDYWYLLLGLPVAVAAALRFAVRRNARARFAWDRVKLRLPVLGDIARKIVLARFAGTFAMMYGAGISVLDAMRANEKVVGNAVIARGLRRAGRRIAAGETIAAAFQHVGLFPPLVIRMLRVGESTGALDRALVNVGYFFNRDVREAVERAQALIEPAVTLAIGVVMGWIMLSVLGPIYDVIAKLDA
ncbi:MAG: type II secretion system F family protein [Rhodocyclaceae bacterium]|nr:type II secretion system F family protein [Rhodocyclaceae bacterium]